MENARYNDQERSMIFKLLRGKNERIRVTNKTVKTMYITLKNVGLLLQGRAEGSRDCV
jgi:hypothetical protein